MMLPSSWWDTYGLVATYVDKRASTVEIGALPRSLAVKFASRGSSGASALHAVRQSSDIRHIFAWQQPMGGRSAPAAALRSLVGWKYASRRKLHATAIRVRCCSSNSNSSSSNNNNDTNDDPTKPPVVHVHSALASGRMDYTRSWAWQQTLLNRRLDYQRAQRQQVDLSERDDADANRDRILLFEHNPVYTLGRGADENHLAFLDSDPDGKDAAAEKRKKLSRKARGPNSARLAVDRLNSIGVAPSDEDTDFATLHTTVDALARCCSPVYAPNDAPIYRVERGGEVTYHGPGQIVGYPLLDLREFPFKQDLHFYLRMVEEVVIQTLKAYDIEGCRDEENTGVWVGDDKVAAVGVSSSRWITTHGFAINVCPDLKYFDTSIIIPCGIEGKGVTSISQILQERGISEQVKLLDVADTVVQSFEKVFGVSTTEGTSLR